MPKVTVSVATKKKISKKQWNDFYEELTTAITSATVLDLTKSDISFPKPTKLRHNGEFDEVIIEISLLFIKPERTTDVRKGLSSNLTMNGKRLLPEARVECFIHPFNPEDGFSMCT